MKKLINRLWLKLILYFKGIRFYKTLQVPKSPEYKAVDIRTVGDHRIEFYFYHETSEDLIFKNGKISQETFVGYVIQARFDEGLPPVLHQYNNLKFFFNVNGVFVGEHDVIVSELINIYLRLITSELANDHVA